MDQKTGKVHVKHGNEAARIVLHHPRPPTKQGKRLQTMITLLLDTGIRANEFFTLKVDDVLIEEGFIKVFGKGRNRPNVPGHPSHD